MQLILQEAKTGLKLVMKFIWATLFLVQFEEEDKVNLSKQLVDNSLHMVVNSKDKPHKDLGLLGMEPD